MITILLLIIAIACLPLVIQAFCTTAVVTVVAATKAVTGVSHATKPLRTPSTPRTIALCLLGPLGWMILGLEAVKKVK